MAGLINYVKKAFKNYPDTTTKISAENLNHLDNGIFNLDQAIGNALGTTDISNVGDGTVKGAISTLNTSTNQLNNDLTANAQKFEAGYQNGKYGFTINGIFYEIGGGKMLDFANSVSVGVGTINYTTPSDGAIFFGSVQASSTSSYPEVRINGKTVFKIRDNTWDSFHISELAKGSVITTTASIKANGGGNVTFVPYK